MNIPTRNPLIGTLAAVLAVFGAATAQAQSTYSLSAVTVPAAPVSVGPFTINVMLTGPDLSGSLTVLEDGVAVAGCQSKSIRGLSGSSTVGVATCQIASPTSGKHNYTLAYRHSDNVGLTQIEKPVTVQRVVPGAIADRTGMWWAGEAENGWGLSIHQHGAPSFGTIAALYVYDSEGRPSFYFGSSSFSDANHQNYLSTSIYQPTSTPFSAYDPVGFKPGTTTGTIGVNFTSANTATMTYYVEDGPAANYVTGTKSLSRQIFAAEDGQPRMQVADLWWAGVEQNGWGMTISQQGQQLFPVWFTYDAQGRATWFAVPGGTWDVTTFTGDIYSAKSSSWLPRRTYGGTAQYDGNAFTATKVGTMTLNFADQSNATMTYTVNGIRQTNTISRQPY